VLGLLRKSEAKKLHTQLLTCSPEAPGPRLLMLWAVFLFEFEAALEDFPVIGRVIFPPRAN